MRNTVKAIVGVVAVLLLIVASALMTGDTIAECEREGHSYFYCYRRR